MEGLPCRHAEANYLGLMPQSAFQPCLPTKAAKVPNRAEWIHEIKHDGYRLIVARDGDRVRLFTRNGHDWSGRYPLITEAALRVRNTSFVIDGEAVLLGVDGVSDFNGLHSRKHNAEVEFYAFDILVSDGEDVRRLPLSDAQGQPGSSCWRAASTASTWRHSSRARSVRTCSATPA